jgi:hypothetical protein
VPLKYKVYLSVFSLYTGVFCLQKTVLLKISTRKGSRIESVPLKKLQSLAADVHKFWSLEGDFLVLHSY